MGEYLQPELHPANTAGSYYNLGQRREPGMEFKAICSCGTANLVRQTCSQEYMLYYSSFPLFLLKGLEQRLNEALHLILSDDKVGK